MSQDPTRKVSDETGGGQDDERRHVAVVHRGPKRILNKSEESDHQEQ